jgi:hypothetical protein
VAEVVVDRIIIQVEEHLEEQVVEGKDLLDQIIQQEVEEVVRQPQDLMLQLVVEQVEQVLQIQ